MHKNDKIIELEKKLIKARDEYYNGDSPLISDEVYDLMVDELTKLYPESAILVDIGAPVKSSGWKKIKHHVPMGSLSKVNTANEIIDWIDKRYDISGYIIMPKYDGLSIQCVYENGKLISASLRGDGFEGFDITPNALKMNGVKSLLNKPFTGIVRGEIIMKYQTLIDHFKEYSNVRNAVNICKRFDGVGCEYLDVIFYKLIGDVDIDYETFTIDYINDLGLNATEFYSVLNANEIINVWEDYQNTIRADLPYQIDGLVVSCNNRKIQEKFGEKALRPDYAVAFKFRPEVKQTSIIDIQWQVGSSGRITPIAIIEPIKLVGATINKATLHNYSNISNKGIDIGAIVAISRRGDIIPAVDAVILNTGTIVQYPKVCSICGSETEFDGEYLICPNIINCPAQRAGAIKNWINAIRILSWGETLVDNLVDYDKVKSIVDLYRLSINDLMELPRVGEKLAKKLVDVLHAEMEIKLERFIGGLSIPTIGETIASTLIAAGYDSIDKMMAASIIDFENISGLGRIKATKLYNGLHNNKHIIYGLFDAGIKIKPIVKGKLTNVSFCFTGELSRPREQLINKVIEVGGIVKSSVVKNLSYLVTADPSLQTTKMKAAIKNGTKIISESEFITLME